ncbi:MAG: LysE family transporter [Rhodobacterales bacterium]|nr:LysE family transporter [Rhodobacterales bacterium]
MTLAAYFTVLLIHLVAAMSPGPSFVVCVRTAAVNGFRVAVSLALGYALGAFLWALAAMAGLALLFKAVPELFIALKVVGGVFLLWISFQMWRHAAEPLDIPTAGSTPRSGLSAVQFGFLTFATNPKTAVFFGAVFVGLVPVDTPLALRAALLVAIFVNEFLWYVVVGRVFSLPTARAAYIRLKTPMDRVFGTLIAFFGAKIALA